MSTNEFGRGPTPDEVLEEVAQEFQQGVVPKLVQTTAVEPSDVSDAERLDRAVREENTLEFEPIAVTRLGGTLPWERDQMQLQCGETIQETNGDQNIRLVYECYCTLTQFETLAEMRANPEAVELVAPSYTGPVNFDELKYERVPEANGGIVRGEGENDEPRYTVQLQSKEDSEDDPNVAQSSETVRDNF
jgi:hypothetical protein